MQRSGVLLSSFNGFWMWYLCHLIFEIKSNYVISDKPSQDCCTCLEKTLSTITCAKILIISQYVNMQNSSRTQIGQAGMVYNAIGKTFYHHRKRLPPSKICLQTRLFCHERHHWTSPVLTGWGSQRSKVPIFNRLKSLLMVRYMASQIPCTACNEASLPVP
jgi:hypothetical protein